MTSLTLIKGLCLSIKEFIAKWEKANQDGKKILEAISNSISELRYSRLLFFALILYRIVSMKKHSDFDLYDNICDDIIQEKSCNVIKTLDKLRERLEILVL